MFKKKKKAQRQQSRQQEILCSSVGQIFELVNVYNLPVLGLWWDSMAWLLFWCSATSFKLWHMKAFCSLKFPWEANGFPMILSGPMLYFYLHIKSQEIFSNIHQFHIESFCLPLGTLTKLNHDLKVSIYYINLFKDG